MIHNFLLILMGLLAFSIMIIVIRITECRILIWNSTRRMKVFYSMLEQDIPEDEKQLIRGRIYNERVKQYRWQRKLK